MNSSNSVSYFCSWVKSKFDEIVDLAFASSLDDVSFNTIESWLTSGDSSWKEEPEWIALKFYIKEVMNGLVESGQSKPLHNIEKTRFDIDTADRILNDEDPFIILDIEYFEKIDQNTAVDLIVNCLISIRKICSFEKIVKIVAAYCVIEFHFFSKPRAINEEEFIKLLDNPPESIVEMFRNGEEIQNGDEFLVIKKTEEEFEKIWKFVKQNAIKKLLDLPQEAEIILEAIRSSMIYAIKTMPISDSFSDEVRDRWIKVILEDKDKDEHLENWWKGESK
jgi:hypothetical protein